MRKVLVLTACMFFLMAGWAQADTLTLGGTYSGIYSKVDPNKDGTWDFVYEGGGSIEKSYLNGTLLPYLYCVDIFTTVYVPGTYPDTLVNDDGKIGDLLVPHADQVAWLLSHYGTAGQGDQAKALQAAIWHVINGNDVYQLDETAGKNPALVILKYHEMLNALGNNTGDISDFYWITPGTKDTSGKIVSYQGLVAPSPVPEPASMFLFGSGLLGMGAVIRRKFQKA